MSLDPGGGYGLLELSDAVSYVLETSEVHVVGRVEESYLVVEE